MSRKLLAFAAYLLAGLVLLADPGALAGPGDDTPEEGGPTVHCHAPSSISKTVSTIVVWGHVKNHGDFDDQLIMVRNGQGVPITYSREYTQPYSTVWDIKYTVTRNFTLNTGDSLLWQVATDNYEDWYTYQGQATTSVTN